MCSGIMWQQNHFLLLSYHLELGKNLDFAVEIFQYQEIFYY